MREVLSYAWSRTFRFFGGWGALLALLAAPPVGLCLHFIFSGTAEMMAELKIWVIYGLAAAGIVFLAIFLWNLAVAPFRIQREKRQVQIAHDVEAAEDAKKPWAEMFLVQESFEWWIEVRGHNAQAEYTATIDFSETSYGGFGRDPALAQWSNHRSVEPTKFIADGSRARFRFYGIDGSCNGVWNSVFPYVRDRRVFEGRSRYSWSEASDPPVPVTPADTGNLIVRLSSVPPMKSGTLKARFHFEGASLTIVDGDVTDLSS